MRNGKRLYAFVLMALGLAVVRGIGAPSANIFPEGDFENAAGVLPEFWHRMGDYTVSARDAWDVDRRVAHSGNASASGTAAAEYVLQGEISPAGACVAEGFIRAETPESTCRVRLSWYSNWSLTGESITVTAGPEWVPFRIEADLDGGKIGRSGTVVELGFLPESSGRFWIDDISLRRVAGPANATQPVVAAVSPRPLSAAEPAAPGPARDGRDGRVTLCFADMPVLPFAFPVRTAVPLPAGMLYDPACLSLVDARGSVLTAQARVLSRWLADRSAQSVLVDFTLAPGTGAPPEVRIAARRTQSPTTIVATADGDASGCRNAAVELALAARPQLTGAAGAGDATLAMGDLTALYAGPLASAWWRRDGFSMHGSAGGASELYVDGYADQVRADVEWVFVNAVEANVSELESISLHLPLTIPDGSQCVVGVVGSETPASHPTPVRVLQAARAGDFRYRVSPPGGGASVSGKLAGWLVLQTADAVWGLAVKDFCWQHPRAVSVDRTGVRLDMWPSEMRDLRLSRGVGPSFRFSVVRGRTAAEVTAMCRALCGDPEALVVADVDAYCRSGVFGVEMTPAESPFPMFERILLGQYPLTHYTYSKFSRKGKLAKRYHGLFDYGDASGDGGWGNAETMLGHAFFQWFFRTGDRANFDVGRTLSRHFRDIDVAHPWGAIHSHCINHTLSGGSPSHSWIQGMRDEYLLSGNLRTLQVLRECGNWLCELDIEEQTGRSLTRVFDNLVDLYVFTGEPRFRDRALAYARLIGARQDPSRVLSGAAAKSWFEHRYTAGTAFVWYGTYALAKLHEALPTDELRRILLTELDISLNACDRIPFILERYPDRRGTYPADPGPAFQAQEIGQWAKGRGAVLWPSLAYAQRLTGDRKYLDVGFLSLGYYMGSMSPETALFATPFLAVLKENGYGAQQERELLTQVARQQAQSYPAALPDPGFETEDLQGWVCANRPRQIVSVRDTEVKLEGAASLRMTSSKTMQKPYTTSTFYCQAPGLYQVRVWCKHDDGTRGALAVNYRRFMPPFGRSYYGGWRQAHPDAPDWRALELTCEVPDPGTLRILIYNMLGKGSVWYDAVEVTRLGDMPSSPAGALLNPGFEDREELRGWAPAAPWLGEYVIDRQLKAAGAASLCIRSASGRSAYVHQTVKLKPGTGYRLAVAVRAADGGKPGLKVEGAGLSAEGTMAEGAQDSRGWSRLTAEFRVPADGEVTITLQNTTGDGAVHYDDVGLAVAESSTSGL